MTKKEKAMLPLDREKLRLIRLVIKEARLCTELGGGKVKFTCKDGRVF